MFFVASEAPPDFCQTLLRRDADGFGGLTEEDSECHLWGQRKLLHSHRPKSVESDVFISAESMGNLGWMVTQACGVKGLVTRFRSCLTGFLGCPSVMHRHRLQIRRSCRLIRCCPLRNFLSTCLAVSERFVGFFPSKTSQKAQLGHKVDRKKSF